MAGLAEETRKITSCEIPQTTSKWCYNPDALCSSACWPKAVRPPCLQRTETPGDAKLCRRKDTTALCPWPVMVSGTPPPLCPISIATQVQIITGPHRKVTGHSVNRWPLLLSVPENSREKSFSPSPGRLFLLQARPPGGVSSGRRKTSRENKKPGVDQTTLSGPTCGSPYLMWSCNCGV